MSVTTTRYGAPAIALHWIAAVVILLLLGHGWWMTHVTPRPDRLANYAGPVDGNVDALAETLSARLGTPVRLESLPL